MFKTDYKKCLFSWNTIILIVAVLLLTCVNYYFSYATKSELIQQLSSGAEDLDIVKLKAWIESYNGFEFFFRYYYLSDEFNISVLALLTWIGIFLVGTYGKFREDGYGNLLVVRSGYKPFFKNYVISRSMYLASLLAIITAIQLVVAFVFGGADSLIYHAGEHTYHFLSCIGILLLQYVLITFYSICIFVISISFSAFIKSNYVLQVFPVVVFGILPMLIFQTLANILNWSQFLVDLFVPFSYMSKIMIIITSSDMQELISVIVSMVFFAVFSKIMFGINVKKMEGNYL